MQHSKLINNLNKISEEQHSTKLKEKVFKKWQDDMDEEDFQDLNNIIELMLIQGDIVQAAFYDVLCEINLKTFKKYRTILDRNLYHMNDVNIDNFIEGTCNYLLDSRRIKVLLTDNIYDIIDNYYNLKKRANIELRQFGVEAKAILWWHDLQEQVKNWTHNELESNVIYIQYYENSKTYDVSVYASKFDFIRNMNEQLAYEILKFALKKLMNV